MLVQTRRPEQCCPELPSSRSSMLGLSAVKILCQSNQSLAHFQTLHVTGGHVATMTAVDISKCSCVTVDLDITFPTTTTHICTAKTNIRQNKYKQEMTIFT